jgi:hypothetical protein
MQTFASFAQRTYRRLPTWLHTAIDLATIVCACAGWVGVVVLWKYTPVWGAALATGLWLAAVGRLARMEIRYRRKHA